MTIVLKNLINLKLHAAPQSHYSKKLENTHNLSFYNRLVSRKPANSKTYCVNIPIFF